jgi:hypothetical protein
VGPIGKYSCERDALPTELHACKSFGKDRLDEPGKGNGQYTALNRIAASFVIVWLDAAMPEINRLWRECFWDALHSNDKSSAKSPEMQVGSDVESFADDCGGGH